MRDPLLERRYAGQVLIEPSTMDRHPVSIDAFTEGEVRHVLDAVQAIRLRDEHVNVDSLAVELQRRGHGRIAQLDPFTWVSAVASPAPIAARLRELSEVRAIHERAQALVRSCEHDADPGKAREHMRELFDLRPKGDSAGRVKPLAKVFDRTAEIVSNPDRRGVCRLGWGSIDSVYQPSKGQLLVLGAPTNVGKTSALSSWAYHVADTQGVPFGVISVEDPEEDFGAKWMAEASRVNSERLWKGDPKDGDVQTALGRIVAKQGLPIFFSEVVDRSLDGVLADMAYMAHRHNVQVIAVDYLQAITLPSGSKDVRSGTDHNLAQLIAQAGRLGVALILACQLARPPKDKPFREPTKYDLKESGTVENRSQCIVMLWKDSEGEVWAKLDKVKRVPFSSKPFPLMRAPHGSLVERAREYDDEPDYDDDGPAGWQ